MQTIGTSPAYVLFVTLAGLTAFTPLRAGDTGEVTDSSTSSQQLTPEQKTAAKLKYNLLDPTPDDLLRPFNTDRPSKTDSPITVDAGHFQLEADFANFTYDRYNALGTNTKVETLLVAPTYLKMGLFENADFQMQIPTYVSIRTDARDIPVVVDGKMRHETAVATSDGYGDMIFRLKINLAGDEGGNFSLAVIPFIKAPTASPGVGNGRVEGGINFPINYALPLGFTLFAQSRFDFLYNGDNSGYHALFSQNIGAFRTIPGILQDKLTGYAEFASAVSSRLSNYDPLVLTADTGLIYQLTPNVALDVDGFFGLTRGAPDVNIFGGIGVRF
jgi:hypothetical protein